MGELVGIGLGTQGGARIGGPGFYRLLKLPFFGRFMKPWRWPLDVPRDRYERAEVPSRSGAALRVLLRRTPTETASGVVLFAHPMGLAAKGFWLKYGHADAFLARGYHVVAFDFNGFGESPSANFDYPGDVISVARYVRRRFPGQRVVLVGASFGAMRSLEAAAEEPGLFDAVVAEAAAPTLPDFWKHYPLPYAVLQASRWIVPAWEKRLRPELLLSRAKALPPTLLIHSRADRWTPPGFGDRIERAAAGRGRVDRLIVDHAEHTHAFRDSRDAYVARVFGFLDSVNESKEQ